MKLNQALKAVAAGRALPVRHQLFLVCGFEPLHLPVFLKAQYAERFPGQALGVAHGVFGDLEGNLDRAIASDASVATLIIEWSDLDSRLGVRSTGPWSGSRQQDIVSDVAQRLERLRGAVERLGRRMPVVVASPSVPFSLAGQTVGWQMSPCELELELQLARFLASFADQPRIRSVHPQRLAARSPVPSRSDLRMALGAGFPFTNEHASVLAGAVLELAYPPPVKKGLITDLDDTLWAGLVGEVGADAVFWSQADQAQLHGLYQSVLRQLAEAGALLAIASKNEAAVAHAALERKDLLVDKDSFFPVAVSWGAKSAAVTAILEAWNVSADSVVVVDDSRMELEEIRSVHPNVTCLEFSRKDPAKCLALLEQLRDLFGTPTVLEEDKLRGASLRSAASFNQQKGRHDMQSFLSGLEGKVTLDGRKNQGEARRVALINKTNQFNLNGLRVSEGEWQRWLERNGSVVLGVSYADRYGALGTIGVLAGSREGGGLRVEHWVLSCRAFSRRIEDHMLRYLFDVLGCDHVWLEYRETGRNKPFSEFLGRLGGVQGAAGTIGVGRAELAQLLVDLPHEVSLVGADDGHADTGNGDTVERDTGASDGRD